MPGWLGNMLRILFGLIFFSLQASATVAEERTNLTGLVLDAGGLPLPGATIGLLTPQLLPVDETKSDGEGRFELRDLAPGDYVLELRAEHFRARRELLRISPGEPTKVLQLMLAVQGIADQISVTASPGSVTELASAAQMVSVVDSGEIADRGHPTIGNALAVEPGVHVQQSTPGQVSPFLRGLTGYHVLNLVDGVRYNNAAFRFGPNQYLTLLEGSQADSMEMTLGPASSEYGSDALGGTIHVLAPAAPYAATESRHIGGRWDAFFGGADLSAGTSAEVSIGTDRLAMLAGGSFRHHNDVRAGAATDSHHVLRRLLGLNVSQIRSLVGDRQRETAFSQFGGHLRLGWRLRPDQQFTLWYQQSEQRGVRGYKDLWGGLGRLQASFEPQRLKLFYVRHHKAGLGPLDSLMSTFSVNSQSEGSLSQGLRYSDPVLTDRTQVDAYGYLGQARTHRGDRQIFVFGAEYYDEHVDSRRLLIPIGSKYRTMAAYGQTSLESKGRRLRLLAGGRLTQVRFHDRDFGDVTFNLALAARVAGPTYAHFLVSRGFRAPNLNDLGATGLQDLGYEFPAESLVRHGGLIGANSSESAPSTGVRISDLGSERLFNYEAGLSWQGEDLRLRLRVFDAELYDAIARRTILFPAGQPPEEIAGVPVRPNAPSAAQAAQDVVPVSTTLDPRAVKAFVNVGRQRYAGSEAEWEQDLPGCLGMRVIYAYLHGRELNPDQPVRRLPPQRGSLNLMFRPPSRWWVEASLEASGAQTRLSGGDLSDERIGAERSRNDIAAFFSGARLRGYVRDGVFLPTGESLAQIQDRVLPRSVAPADNTRVPLYRTTAGFAALHLRMGFRFTNAFLLNLAVGNVLDKNYRVHGSGSDAPGRYLAIRCQYRF